MKISLLEPLGVEEKVVSNFGDELKNLGHEFVYYDNKTTDVNELKSRTGDSDIVIIANNAYPDEVVQSAQNLKMIAVAFTGIDHVGQDSCKSKDVMICNAAGYSNQTVAELAIGMAIDVLRNISAAETAVRNGKTSAGLMGREIFGKTVGIIGVGKIGLYTAKLFKAFGADVLGYSRHESEEAKKAGVKYVELDELLKTSDIVSLHMPLNSQTKGFIDAEKINMMKKDAIFINCARGAIVDNNALADALNNDKIAGAAIDVFDSEPPIPSDYPLLNAKNTLLTPHVAFLSKESMLRRADITFNNVLSYIKGSPQNVCKL